MLDSYYAGRIRRRSSVRRGPGSTFSAGRAWRRKRDCRDEYEGRFLVQAILHHFLEVAVPRESDARGGVAQEAARARRCNIEGLLLHWERVVDGIAVGTLGTFNEE